MPNLPPRIQQGITQAVSDSVLDAFGFGSHK